MALKIVVLLGTVRSDRKGSRAAAYVERGFRGRGHDVSRVDPVEIRLPLLGRMYKEFPKGTAPPPLEELAVLYRSADAFVVVCGEYNHSIPPALSNLLDHFLEEYFWRPSAIVCYSTGQFGGVRAAMQLRAMLCELGMPSIPSLCRFRGLLPRSGKTAHRPMRRSTGDSPGLRLNSSGMRPR